MCASATATTSASWMPCGASASNHSRSACMRRIIRRRELVADDARYAGEEAGQGARAVQPVTQFIAALSLPQPIDSTAAVLIGPSDELEALAPHLALVSLIVVEFPKIGEGRGYSQ